MNFFSIVKEILARLSVLGTEHIGLWEKVGLFKRTPVI